LNILGGYGDSIHSARRLFGTGTYVTAILQVHGVNAFGFVGIGRCCFGGALVRCFLFRAARFVFRSATRVCRRCYASSLASLPSPEPVSDIDKVIRHSTFQSELGSVLPIIILDFMDTRACSTDRAPRRGAG
jgi:hypothetical protein